MAFATYTDVEDRWHALTAEEQVRATALLDDASAMISAALRRAGVGIDGSDDEQATLIKKACCAMVIRAMMAGASSAFGIDQMQASMGPFGQNVHFSNPSGDLYISKQEEKDLGIAHQGKGRILHPTIGGDLRAELPYAL